MSAVNDVLARAMSEAELQANIIALCGELGFPVGQMLNFRATIRGWPDLVIIARTKIIYRELKSERGTLSPDQRDTGTRIRAAGGNWAVWRPRDWVTGRIQDELRMLAGQPLLPLEAVAS
jgi:hypothetical protein